MRHATQWVLFDLDGGRYALLLTVVERVVRAASVTPLPGAPDVVIGAVNIAGHVLPVFDLRRRLGLPARELHSSDHFLIARTADRRVVLVIDAPAGLLEGASQGVVDASRIAQGMPHIRGVITGPDGLVLIHDLDRFLSAAEALELDAALDSEVRYAS